MLNVNQKKEYTVYSVTCFLSCYNMESKQCQIELRYIIVYSCNILIIFIIKQSDILLYQKLIVPVHMGAHWCLAVVDFVQKEFRYYDSMLGDNMKCLERIR